MSARNARFWIYWNLGPVKITLRPGETRNLFYGVQTDEGWASEALTYTHEGDHVRRSWIDDGVDCDGRLTRCGEDVCPLGELHSNEPYHEEGEPTPDWMWPAWQKESSSQRDYSAEAMTY